MSLITVEYKVHQEDLDLRVQEGNLLVDLQVPQDLPELQELAMRAAQVVPDHQVHRDFQDHCYQVHTDPHKLSVFQGRLGHLGLLDVLDNLYI